jgi:NAD(P)-dependent dehydrogenase (short-subunit alcohol dehydrogenase family)
VAILNAGITGGFNSITDFVLAAPEPSVEENVIPERPKRTAIAVNLLGMYDGAWLALHYMRLPAKDGSTNASKSLILTGSLASYIDQPYATDYNASKCK